MKKLYQYTMILLAGVLGACSSLEVSDPYSENLPADFDTQQYMALYPILRSFQIKDYVADRNKDYKDAVTSAGGDYAAIKSTDSALFVANIEALFSICSNPFLGGFSTDTCATIASNPAMIKSLATDFNIVSRADDLVALSQIPVDEVAISQQYVVFGQSHGWAYRLCNATELANITREQVKVRVINDQGIPVDSSIVEIQSARASSADKFVPDPGIYCKDPDTGVRHLVNQ